MLSDGLSRNQARAIAAIVLAAVALGVVAYALAAPADQDGELVAFTVESGWGGARIASELQRAGLVRSATGFLFIARLTGVGDALQAGTYELSPAMSPRAIARLLADGNALSDDVLVTVPEGMNVWEVDRVLAGAGLLGPGDLRSRFAFKEGHLFPETYRFASGSSAEDVVRRMEATYFERGGTRGDTDLIVASMLEKEAKSAEDMALVAGIIARRMELGMPLQIDATVGYGWCVRTHGFLRDCDVTQAPIATEIKVDGPYNTYTRTGLPQGAISNPGEQALRAAANPVASDYLYYLSTRDGSRIIYSKTLQEHLQNRAEYLGF